MSAVLDTREAGFEEMTADRLDEVLDIERGAYDHPWTAGNFSDSLRSGYEAQLLVAGGQVLGYFVAMKGVDEVHLLNLTVAPALHGQGWGRTMLDALALWSRGQGAQWLWLDKDGKKVFSDRPPPSDIASNRILKQPGVRNTSVDVAPAAPATTAAVAPGRSQPCSTAAASQRVTSSFGTS